jgi:hypothetical protein
MEIYVATPVMNADGEWQLSPDDPLFAYGRNRFLYLEPWPS